MAEHRGNPSNRIVASSTSKLNKGESMSAELPYFGIYIISNGHLRYGYSGLIFAYTNVGVTIIAGDTDVFTVNAEDYAAQTIKITNNASIAVNILLYSLY